MSLLLDKIAKLPSPTRMGTGLMITEVEQAQAGHHPFICASTAFAMHMTPPGFRTAPLVAAFHHVPLY